MFFIARLFLWLLAFLLFASGIGVPFAFLCVVAAHWLTQVEGKENDNGEH